MIIEVNGRPLNLYQILYYCTRDERVDESTPNYNIYYRLTDGRIITEEFTS